MNGYGNRNGRKRGNFSRGDNKKSAVPPKELEALDVPENYVDAAEQVMRKLGLPDNRNAGKLRFGITTSKLRNILTLVSDIYNVENRRKEDTISDESAAKLQQLRIRVLYEAGRESSVDEFVRESCILQYIKGIDNDRKKMIRFAHYMEALVAYHRFFGGRD